MATTPPAGAPPSSPRNLIVLSDGTGNSSAKLFRTNVWRVYDALDLTCPDQIALYDDGVGTASFKPLAILGGGFGHGLKRNVLDLYMFLCRNHQPGDRIFAFGFSRGAFTVGSVVALVAQEGLIQGVTDDTDLKRLASWAYRNYRASKYRDTWGVRMLRRARNGLFRLVDRLRRLKKYERTKNRDVEIDFLGVWDTVAAYGLPIDELTRGWDQWIWPMLPRERRLSPKVKRACHAVAIDDERQTFFPLLWDESLEPANAGSVHTNQERMSQVWFAGVHSNVGGGYPDDSLAFQPLCWIAGGAAALGLKFQKNLRPSGALIPDAWVERAAPCAPMNDSRRGAGTYYRYHPRPIARLCNDRDSRVKITRPKIHESVFERVRDGRDGYAPFMLPQNYAVVTAAGTILEGDADATPPAPAPNRFEHSTQAAARVNQQQVAWNVVWRRRVAYFATVGATLLLLLTPMIPWFATSEPVADTYAPLKAVVDVVGMFVPSFAEGWLDYYRAHATQLIVGGGLVALLIWWSGRLKRAIVGRMGVVWRNHGLVAKRVGPAPEPEGWIYRLRTSPAYVGFFRFLSLHFWPTVFGAAMLATLAVVLPVRAAFEWTSRSGSLCAANTAATGTGPWEFAFDPRSICHATNVQMERGGRYLVQIALPPACGAWSGPSHQTGQPGQWHDGRFLVDSPAGFASSKSPVFIAAWPFRRVLNQHWFVPIAAIGTALPERHPLSDLTGSNTFIAGRRGPLTLFVNDAVIPLTFFAGTGSAVCAGWECLYRNNAGGPARVRVTKLAHDELVSTRPEIAAYTCEEQLAHLAKR